MKYKLTVLAFVTLFSVIKVLLGAPSASSSGKSRRSTEWDLVRRSISNVSENAVLSPFSIEVVLSILSEALDYDEPAFMQLVEFIPELENIQQFRRNMNATLASMKQRAPANNLNLATKLFVRNGLEIDKSFKKIINSYYDANVEYLDFGTNIIDSLRTINEWCSKATGGNIPKLLTENDVSFYVIALLINVIYFKAEWKYPFDSSFNENFKLDSGKIIKKVRCMSQTGNFSYYKSSQLNAQIVSLPYKNEKFSMNFLLPSVGEPLEKFIKRIDLQALDTIESQMEVRLVTLTLPKFKFSYSTDVADVLGKLGIYELFLERTNFPGFDNDNLKISKIIQKAGIAIGELGTEAFAAAIAEFDERIDDDREYFDATHPFLFYVKDSATNRILFAGKVLNPKL